MAKQTPLFLGMHSITIMHSTSILLTSIILIFLVLKHYATKYMMIMTPR